MANDKLKRQNGTVSQFISWKRVLLFLALPILLNVVNEGMELLHFNTFNGSPGDAFIAQVSFHVGNWPSLLLKKYPHVLADGDVVYEVSGWMNPVTLFVNLFGWSLLGLIVSYALQKRKRPTKESPMEEL